MFRRETVHSHFFVHFSPFPVFSAPYRVVCSPHRRFFRASGACCGGVFSLFYRAVPSPSTSPCRLHLVMEQSSTPARVGVRCLEGRMSVVFLFLLESRKKPCHPGENVEQNAADNPGRKREKARRERQEF